MLAGSIILFIYPNLSFDSEVSYVIVLNFLFLSCRTEAFNSIFGQHMRTNRLDLITISELEGIVNSRSDTRYTSAEITFLLEVKLILLHYFNDSSALGT